MPCQHHPTHRGCLKGSLWTSYKPRPPINFAFADGKWGQRALGAACSTAATPLPAQGLCGELSEIQQSPQVGLESAGRRKTAAVSCSQPPLAAFSQVSPEGNQQTFPGFLMCFSICWAKRLAPALHCLSNLEYNLMGLGCSCSGAFFVCF